MEKLKEFELEMNDCLVYHQSIKGFIEELLEKQKQQYKKEFLDWFKNGTADIEDFIEEVFK
jgi:hypothetical protein